MYPLEFVFPLFQVPIFAHVDEIYEDLSFTNAITNPLTAPAVNPTVVRN